MNILGISGGFDSFTGIDKFTLPDESCSDAASVLLQDGEVKFAIEEERLNRVPRTNKRPLLSIKRGLEEMQLTLGDIDKIAVYGEEKFYNYIMQRNYLANPNQYDTYSSIRQIICNYLCEAFQERYDARNIVFVKHQHAHTISAFACSGFDRSLVLSLDKSEDWFSGLVAKASADGKLEALHLFRAADSLPTFCQQVSACLPPPARNDMQLLMMAPDGDASIYRSFMKSCFQLLPNGTYKLHLDRNELSSVLAQANEVNQFRKACDLAAALQEMLELIIVHVIGHYQKTTGESNLCIAGEITAYPLLNSKLLQLDGFTNLHVQPIPHDADAALGAALSVYRQESGNDRPFALSDLYWGGSVLPDLEIYDQVQPWGEFVHIQQNENAIEDEVVRLVTSGHQVGWMQGRSEFGCHSLGNRCLLYDPRTALKQNGDASPSPVILSIHEDALAAYLEVPPGICSSTFRFGHFSLPWKQGVRVGNQETGGKYIQIQSVNRGGNPQLWSILEKFKQATGLPFLVQSPINNKHESKVETMQDAIVSMLTSDFNYLAIGNVLVKKQLDQLSQLLDLKLILPPYATVHQKRAYVSPDEFVCTTVLKCRHREGFTALLTPELYEVLMKADGSKTVLELLLEIGVNDFLQLNDISNLVYELWEKRFVLLQPAKRTKPANSA